MPGITSGPSRRVAGSAVPTSVEADVLVIGAGPAGSATATHLARRGLHVALLEKAQFPREKVCGDGLTPRATRQLIRLGIDTSEAGRLAAQQGAADLRRRASPSSCTGQNWRTSPRTGWFGRAPTSTTCWPATRSPPAPSCTSGRTWPRRSSTTRRIASSASPPKTDAEFTRPAGRRRRRQLDPAQPGHGSAPARRPSDGRGGADLLPQPAASRRLPGVLAGAVGRQARGRALCCPATAGSSGWATAPATSAWASSTPRRPSARRDYQDLLQRWLDNTPEEWGFREREHDHSRSGRGAADGLQPPAALHPGPAAGRRRRRHGEPVQRRGHRVRDGVRRARRRRHRRGALPRSRARRAPSARCESYPAQLKSELGGYYTLGRAFVKLIGKPPVMKACTKYGLPRKTLMRFALKLHGQPDRQPGRRRDGQDHQLARPDRPSSMNNATRSDAGHGHRSDPGKDVGR